ncbi:MAG TPA: hypothetical protein VMU08_14440 [Rhizomicrobium sp.]|nr:hypothetical protein [Rhizomicrobium sp.]
MTKHHFIGALIAGSIAFAAPAFAADSNAMSPPSDSMTPHGTMAPASNGMAPHGAMAMKKPHHTKKTASSMAAHNTMAPASSSMAPASAMGQGGGMSGSH